MNISYSQSPGNGRGWHRVSKRRPCPVCGKPDWCLYSEPENDPSAAICARIESSKRCSEAGWLHRLRDDSRRYQRSRRRRAVVDAGCSTVDRGLRDFERFAVACFDAISPSTRERLADDLGVSVDSLVSLRVGWSPDHRAFSFPMTDAAGAVRGVRLRGRNARKWSVCGGREGLFIPSADAVDPSSRILMCEGPTDAAALFDLGFDVVGRPSCTGGVRLIVELMKFRKPDDVAIIADADAPGLRGANNLSAVLAAYVPSVRVLMPPAGIKDARDWKRQGATHHDVQVRIAEAKPRRLGIVAVEREGTQRRKEGKR